VPMSGVLGQCGTSSRPRAAAGADRGGWGNKSSSPEKRGVEGLLATPSLTPPVGLTLPAFFREEFARPLWRKGDVVEAETSVRCSGVYDREPLEELWDAGKRRLKTSQDDR